MSSNNNLKEHILPLRATRRLTLTPWMILGIVLTFPLLILNYSALRYYSFLGSGESLNWIVSFFKIPAEQVTINLDHIGNIWFHYLVVPIAAPSKILSLIVVSVVFVTIFVLPKLLKSLPKVILINLLLSIVGCFALLFLIIPEHFMHSSDTFSFLFAMVSILVLLGGPVLFWLAIAPTPIGLFRRMGYMILFEIVLIVLFFLKYALFIILCTYGTYLIIPYIVIFVFSFLDILYLNSIFSFMISKVSPKVNNNRRLWQKT